MNLHRLRALLLEALSAGLRPLALALFAKAISATWPATAVTMDLAALAGVSASLLMIARVLVDRVLDPTDPDRLLVEDVSAAGLFHDFLRRLVAWTACLIPLCLTWSRFGYRTEVEAALWFAFKLGVAYLVLTRLMQRKRVVRLIRAEAGSGYRILREMLSRTYSLVTAFVFLLLALWGAGYTEVAGFLTRAGMFTVLFASLGAAGWSLIDRLLGPQGGGREKDAELPEDLPEGLMGSGAGLAAWTSRDVLRKLSKGALSFFLVLGLYFAWGGSAVYLRLLYETYHYTIGLSGVQVSLARLVEALIYIGLCLGLSSLVRGFLERSVFPNMPIDRGIAHAISSMTHYALIGVAGLLVIEIFGIGSESLKWLAGFIGIGVGFGMQTIVNNLASGLILLAERPIKPGDRVQVGSYEGEITKISVRATTIKSLDNIETIVPNSEFTGAAVTNWSYTDSSIRLHVPVGVAYGSDVKLVKDALLKVARNHRLVLKRPRPDVFFTGFGNSSLDFDLLVWIAYPFLGPRIRSDLNFAIDAEFRRRAVEIPFPQRDLHIRSGLPAGLGGTAETRRERVEAEAPAEPPKRSLPG